MYFRISRVILRLLDATVIFCHMTISDNITSQCIRQYTSFPHSDSNLRGSFSLLIMLSSVTLYFDLNLLKLIIKINIGPMSHIMFDDDLSMLDNL